MHKTDLALIIAKKTNLDERGALSLLNLVLDEVAVALKKGKRVTLTGFGTFEIRKRKKRVMHNVHDGSSIVVPAHKLVGFIQGRELKESVR